MIEQWQPATTTHAIDLGVLQHLASEPHTAATLNTELLNDEQLTQLKSWIQHSEQQWQSVLPQLSDDQLLMVARWYVRAEMELSGWESGANNPAIWVFRWLKQQKRLPDKEHIRALKALTQNRFIPYGKVL
jgi:hypothetical protein